MTLKEVSLVARLILSCRSSRMSRGEPSSSRRETTRPVTVSRVTVSLPRLTFPVCSLRTPSHPTRHVYNLPYDVPSSWFGAIWPQRMINRQTVHRSLSLFERNRDTHPEDAYGDKFRYDECLKIPGPISTLFVDFSILLFVVPFISPVRYLAATPV